MFGKDKNSWFLMNKQINLDRKIGVIQKVVGSKYLWNLVWYKDPELLNKNRLSRYELDFPSLILYSD